MLKIFVVAFMLLGSLLHAGSLSFQEGTIKAHTQVFGDSGIDPFTTQITSNLVLGSDLTQLTGSVSIPSMSLKSDNEDRDEHMHETLHADVQKNISISLTKVEKVDNQYKIYANLLLNGVTKPIVSLCNIKEDNKQVVLDGKFSINMTDYNIEQPSLLFFKVRNQVDIAYNLKYRK